MDCHGTSVIKFYGLFLSLVCATHCSTYWWIKLQHYPSMSASLNAVSELFYYWRGLKAKYFLKLHLNVDAASLSVPDASDKVLTGASQLTLLTTSKHHTASLNVYDSLTEDSLYFHL